MSDVMQDGMSLRVAGVNLCPVDSLCIGETQRIAVHDLLNAFTTEDVGDSADSLSISGAFFGPNAEADYQKLRDARKKGEPVPMVYVAGTGKTISYRARIQSLDGDYKRNAVTYTIQLVEVEAKPVEIARKTEPPDTTLQMALAKLAQMQAAMAVLTAARLAYAISASAGNASTALAAALAVAEETV